MEDATCWWFVDWCWQCWHEFENSLVYCESFDDACCLCWLCWRCWQRNPSFETKTELEMTVLMDVATCCLCWLCWRCRQRETSPETRTELGLTMLMDVGSCCCCDDWCWQMLMEGFAGESLCLFFRAISTHLELEYTTRAIKLHIHLYPMLVSKKNPKCYRNQ